MFTVTGKLSNKSLVKSGVSENGAWKIVVFIIEKTRHRNIIRMPFTAKGKLANIIDDIPVGERLTIDFYIDSKKFNGKYYTDCIATCIEKYVPKKKYIHGQVSFENQVFIDNTDIIQKDLHLFNQENEK